MVELTNSQRHLSKLTLVHMPDGDEKFGVVKNKIYEAFEMLKGEQSGTLFKQDILARDEMVENAEATCGCIGGNWLGLHHFGDDGDWTPRKLSALERDWAVDRVLAFEITHPAKFAYSDLIRVAPRIFDSGSGDGLFELGVTGEMIFARRQRLVGIATQLLKGSGWSQTDIDNYVRTAVSFVIDDEDPRYSRYCF